MNLNSCKSWKLFRGVLKCDWNCWTTGKIFEVSIIWKKIVCLTTNFPFFESYVSFWMLSSYLFNLLWRFSVTPSKNFRFPVVGRNIRKKCKRMYCKFSAHTTYNYHFIVNFSQYFSAENLRIQTLKICSSLLVKQSDF